ncbi:hypothetical protein UlMin_018885 [Ulmus minor]
MGKRKIEMKLVKDNSSKQVTFSKRRNGLFKKANEIATLCGVEVAVVTFSPGGKPFSYGHPDVDTTANRFLNQQPNPTQDDHHDGNQTAMAEKLSQEFTDLQLQLEVEKKRGKMIAKENKKEKDLLLGGQASICELSLEELEKLKESLEKLGEKVREQINEKEVSSTLLLLSEKPI